MLMFLFCLFSTELMSKKINYFMNFNFFALSKSFSVYMQMICLPEAFRLSPFSEVFY